MRDRVALVLAGAVAVSLVVAAAVVATGGASESVAVALTAEVSALIAGLLVWLHYRGGD